MNLLQKAWYKVCHPIWWVWYFYIKRPALQLYHRHFPHKHDWQWVGIYECGCCGYEGMTCESCRQYVIIGHTTWSNGDPEDESGDFEENGY